MTTDDYWSLYRGALAAALSALAIKDHSGAAVDHETAFARLCAWAREVQGASGTIHFIGNGASACMASHMALDWTKNGRVPAVAHNDIASLTALGNDLGYSEVFARPIGWFGRTGDLLVAISTSGNSANIHAAIAVARAKRLRVVTFSGLRPNNKSRQAGDLNFFIPAWSYGTVECCHQVLLHTWLDRFMEVKEWEMDRPQTFEA